MTIQQLSQKFEEIYLGTPWHGSSLVELLSNIPEDHYITVVAPGKKSIAHLLEHILAWRQLGIEALKGNRDFKIQLNTEEDWPKPKPMGETKNYYLSALEKSQKEILKLLSEKEDRWLEETTPNKNYKNEYLMQGIVEHDLYHSGQIGIFNSLLNT